MRRLEESVVTVQPFEYLLFCAIIIHLCAITSESGRRNHSEAGYVLDIIILCFYLYVAVPSPSFCALLSCSCEDVKNNWIDCW
jgi:hypothetical protein